MKFMSTETQDRTREFANRLIEAREGGGKASTILDGENPLDMREACEIQAIVAERFGPAGAFKVARKSGQPVIMAPIYQRDIHASPASFPVKGEEAIGIELEIGFKILTALPSPDEKAYEDRLKECVALVPAIEIVLTRLADADAPPMVKLADNQINGGLVVGHEVHDWQGMDLTQANARLTFDGKSVVDGVAPVPGGDAFENFRALAENLGNHCGGLKPGHVVITGSLNGLPYVSPGTAVRGWIDGLGEVAVDVRGVERP